jgi:hypothetical protein
MFLIIGIGDDEGISDEKWPSVCTFESNNPTILPQRQNSWEVRTKSANARPNVIRNSLFITKANGQNHSKECSKCYLNIRI